MTDMTEYHEWVDTHCYGCGLPFSAIEASGPTVDCICDPTGAEYKAWRIAYVLSDRDTGADVEVREIKWDHLVELDRVTFEAHRADGRNLPHTPFLRMHLHSTMQRFPQHAQYEHDTYGI